MTKRSIFNIILTVAFTTLALGATARAANPVVVENAGPIVVGCESFAGGKLTLEPVAHGSVVALLIDGQRVALYNAVAGGQSAPITAVILAKRNDGSSEITGVRTGSGDVRLTLAAVRRAGQRVPLPAGTQVASGTGSGGSEPLGACAAEPAQWRRGRPRS
jgi:hypothetical protein